MNCSFLLIKKYSYFDKRIIDVLKPSVKGFVASHFRKLVNSFDAALRFSCVKRIS